MEGIRIESVEYGGTSTHTKRYLHPQGMLPIAWRRGEKGEKEGVEDETKGQRGETKGQGNGKLSSLFHISYIWG